MKYAIDYAITGVDNATLAVRHNREQAEDVFTYLTNETRDESVKHPVRLVAIHKDQTETIIAIGFAD